MPDGEDKLSYLVTFCYRYSRTGQRGRPVRSGTVSKVLKAIAKGISNLGHPDPRYPISEFGVQSKDQYPLLTDFVRGLEKEDDPAGRSYPVNVTILRALFTTLDVLHRDFGTLNRHIQNLIVVAFFWLLRPAEYLNSESAESRSQAFRFQDIHFTIDGKVYNACNAPLHDENDLDRITFASLQFFDQKNAVRGEQVGHRPNDDPLLCPAKALGRIAIHLKRNKAKPSDPIHRHYNRRQKKWHEVKPEFVTNALRHAATDVEPTTGIKPSLISARSLRPGGATALLCAGVDSDAIQLLGRWKSDAMLRYLRIQAAAIAQNFAQKMLDHGSYTFHPTNFADQGLPNEAPPAVIELVSLSSSASASDEDES